MDTQLHGRWGAAARAALVAMVLAFAALAFAFPAHAATSENLALGRDVTYSGVEGDKKADGTWTYPQFTGEKAVDGKADTRWSAAKTDDQWLQVDLGKAYDLGSVVLSLHAESPEYELLASEDGEVWENLLSVTGGSQGDSANKTVDARGHRARYVKYHQLKMWKHKTNGKYYGSSVIEFEVYAAPAIDPSSDTLAVASFNIAANKNPDLPALRALTEAYGVEVVGLQEVDMNTGRNPFDMLARFAGDTYPHTYFSKAIDFSGGEYGIGTASRYPLSDSSTTQVDSEGMEEQRVFQRSLITKGDRTIAFYNTHLSYETQAKRAEQMTELKAALKADPTPYKVVTGDFNADQDHHEFDLFLEELDMVNGAGGTWLDTFNGTDATMKVNSVDNIIHTRNMEVTSSQMVETKLSDHNMLLATFKLLDEPYVSREWLRARLEVAEGLAGDSYSSSSWDVFAPALSVAQRVMADEGSTQASIDAAARDLDEAMDQLESKNLALGRETTASGTEVTDGRFTAAMATDGVISKTSRWSGAKQDEQWLQVDLGSDRAISDVVIRFESQSPSWELQLSLDGKDWKTVYTRENGPVNGDSEDVTCSFARQEARYVRYVQHKMWTHASNGRKYSTSIYELEVYERIDVTSIALDGFRDLLGVGDSFKVACTIEPAEAAAKPLVYTSSDPKVATVDEDGVVTAKAPGTATITVASRDDPGVSASAELRVIDGFAWTLDTHELFLTPRAKRFLTYAELGDVPTGTTASYTVDDPSVATVDAKTGLVIPQAQGTTTVHLLANGVEQDGATVTVSPTTYNADYDTMQDRWLARVTGGEGIDLSDKDVMAYVAKISEEGRALWDELDTSKDRTTLWPKISTDTTSADYTSQITKIKKLALAFGTKGSELYRNPELLDDIVDALQFMNVAKKYNGSYTTGNWWDWQIGCTQPLCDILMIVSDYVDYSEVSGIVSAIEGYAKAPSKRYNGYTETGANRTDTGLAVLGSAIVAKNDARMKLVQDEVPDVMKLVTSGDGMYADGSVVQHTKVAYTGAYGNELIKGVGRINSIIAGTQWDITDPRIENVYETVLNGYIPLMHRGQQMAMVNGRSISRAPGLNNFTTEFESGSETISNILLIAQFAPEEYRTAFLSAVKGWLEDSAAWVDDFDFYGHARDFDALLQAKAVMGDESVAATRWEGMKVYGSMDRVIQATGTYEAGLAMYSKRIYSYEGGVGSGSENQRGWHTGSGMLYIYNGDLAQFGEGYWPTVDSYRLPGTTVDTRELGVGANQSKASPQAWAGGVTDGENGAAGMVYNANGMSGMNVKANKSWFFLPGQVVALGANISGTTDASIETTIEDRMLTSDANEVTVNGEAYDGAAETRELKAGSYAHLTGTGEGNDLGYYLIDGATVDLQIEERSGTYADINGVFPSTDVYTKTYFKMGIDHGQQVSGGSYAYVILPGASEGETASYGEHAVRVLQNDATAQAVMDEANKIVAFNTWPEEKVEVAGLSVDNSASVFAQVKDGKLTVSLANPKQSNVDITLGIGIAHGATVSMSDGVADNGDGTFTFTTNGLAGATQSVTVEVGDPSALMALIDEASALVEDAYTPETWAVLVDALADARELVAALAPAQDDLDAAATALRAAIDGLEQLAPELDVTAAERVLAEARALEEGAYTVESWKALADAVASLEEGLGTEGISQDDLDALVAKVRSAIDGLETAPVPDPDPDPEPTPDPGPDPEPSPDPAPQPGGKDDATTDAAGSTSGKTAAGHKLPTTGDVAAIAGVLAIGGSALAGIGAARRRRK